MGRRIAPFILVLIALMLPAHIWAGAPPFGAWSPPALPPDAIVPSDAMGYLSGNSRVTPAGDFVWSLPLWTPPSRENAKPDLSISYGARGGNGILGVGFGLSGLPEIRRCGRTMATHGEVRGILYSSDDRFCLDGNPLVLLSGLYGKDGSEYRAERDGFDKIVFHEGAGAFSPSFFEAWAKDGRIIRYESLKAFRAEVSLTDPYTIAPENLVDVVWPLAEVQNRSGDRVVYRHVLVPSPDPFAIEYVLDRIEYPLRPGEETGKHEARFLYENRPDPSFTWISGVSFRTTKRLHAIEMHAPNPNTKGIVQRYEFAYLKSASTERSLLKTISRCDGDNACLWSKQFEWENSYRPNFAEPIELDAVEYDDFFFLSQSDSGIQVLDTDADGRDEILYRIGAAYFLRRMDGNGVPLGERIWIDPVATAPGPGTFGFHDIFVHQSRAVDFDGDGAVELWAAQPLAGGFHIFGFDPVTGQPASKDMLLPAGMIMNGGAVSLEAVNFADIDGDALPDILQQVFVDPSNPVWGVGKNQGNFEFNGTLTDVGAYCGDSARAIDSNGDGRAEIWNASQFGCGESATMAWGSDDQPIVNAQHGLGFEAKRAMFVDLNGDGLRDIVRPGSPGWVRFSTGVGYGPKQDLVNGPYLDGNAQPGMDQGMNAVDLNADGKEDVLTFRYDPAPKIIAYLSLGNGSFIPVEIAEWPGQFHASEGFSTSRVGDFNGDSLMDVVVVGADHRFRVLLQEPGHVDVVHAIGDSVTQEPREVIHYSHAFSDAPEPAACVFPQRCIRHGVPVVREHWTWQGSDVGQYRKESYDFQDPRVDLHGRGFLGFGKMRVRDIDRRSETIITFDHKKRLGTVYPEAGLPKTVTHIAPILEQLPASYPATVRARITEVENTYALNLLEGGKTHAVHPLEWDSSEWEQDVILKSDGVEVPYDAGATILRERSGSFVFDDYGNATKATEQTKDGVLRVVEATYEIRPDDWLISLPDAVTYVTSENDPTTIGGIKHVPAPRVVKYIHDDLGLLKSIHVEPGAIDPHEQLTTTFERNDDGLVTQITSETPGELPRHVNIEYDAAEGIFPVKVWSDLNEIEGFAFHPAYGVLAVSRDANGVETRAQHDAFGRLRRVERDGEAGTDIISSVTLKSGWVAGLVEHVKSDAGDEGYTIFDELGRPVEEAVRAFDGQWSRSAVAYDHLGRTIHVTRPELGGISLHKTQYVYDTLDRLIHIQAPDGSSTEYDHEFFKVTRIEFDGPENTLVFDADGRIEQSIDFLYGQGVPTTFVYESFDLISHVIDPEGNVTWLNYDKRGRRVALLDPDRGLTFTTYNGFDEVLTEESALGQITTFKRDILGRVYEREDADGVTKFFWSAQQGRRGLLDSTESPDGTTTHHLFDDFGRPTTSTWTLSAGEAFSITKHYDLFGRLKSIDYPAVPERLQFSVEYDYTPHNYLDKIRDPASQGLPFWTVQGRNADGALTQALRGDGAIHTRSYKPLTGQLHVLTLEKSGVALDSLSHTYYLNGNLKSRIDSVNGRTETFQYDNLERLTSWTLETSTGKRATTYHYDLIGNLKQVHENGAIIADNEYGANGRPHALTSTNGVALQSSFTYDAIGRIIQGGGRDIEYTAFDLPKSITQNGETTDFLHDAFGRRIRKSRPGSSSIYIAELYEKREKNGETDHVFYIPGEFGPVAEVHWKHGKPQEDKTLYLHGDGLGSTRVIMGGQGNWIERSYFDPFGQRIEYDGTPSAQGYSASTEIGLTGFHYDDDLGLINARGRIYDPTIRRFITPDPLVAFPLFGQSYNRFSFCLNNPLRFTDPTGFVPQDGPPNLNAAAPRNLDPPRRPRPPPRKSSPGHAKPMQGGANGVTTEKADANGHETSTGPRAPAATPPASTPPPAAETASEPVTAAPSTASPSAPEPGPPVGPPPPASAGAGNSSGIPEPQSWKDHRVAQTVGGYLAGLALGCVPGGGIGGQVLTFTGVLPSGSRHAQMGRAVGEMMGGVILMVAGTGGSIGGGLISLSGVGAAVGVPAAAVSAGLITAGAGNFASGLAGLGRALSTGSGAGTGPAAKLTGQQHHPISKKVHRALENHKNLKGHYKYRDPRFVTRGKDLGAHNGYERWHIDLDKEIVEWIVGNKSATPESFEQFLRDRYARPDLKARFPNGL